MTELPKGWEVKTLADVAEWTSGGTPSSADSTLYGGEIPWIVIGDLTESVVNETEKTINKKGLESSSAKLLPAGTVMVAMYGASIGRTGVMGKEMATNQALACGIPNGRLILGEYLLYFLQSQKQEFILAGKGGAQPNISQGVVKAWKIPLPPLAEQHQIVRLLDEHLPRLDVASADVKQAKIKAAQFRKVYIDDSLKKSEGVKTKLGDILKFTSGFAYKSSVWQDTGIPVVKIMNVKHREVNLQGCSFISPKIAENSKSFAVKKGDLLFNMTGATLGAFGFYNLEQEARMNQRVGKFVPLNSSELNLNYLAYFLEAASTQQMIQQLAKGAAQPNISPTDILSLEINLPDFAVQNAIVEELEAGLSKVTQVDQLCNITKVKSKAFRRSLLQAAFTGQLTKEVVSV
jgi:type I restriction enzyme S subunit